MDARVSLEIVKLLVQVAWADHEVAETEIAHILERARAAGLEAADTVAIEAALRGQAPAPAPDLGFLRAHRDAALAAAEDLVGGEPGSDSEEGALLDELRALLG